MRGVPDTSQGWRPDARAGFVPPHDVGRHRHSFLDLNNVTGSTPYTPGVGTVAADNGVTVGNGTLTASYIRFGDMVQSTWGLVLGSSSSFASGGIAVSLPIPADPDQQNGNVTTWARNTTNTTRDIAGGGLLVDADSDGNLIRTRPILHVTPGVEYVELRRDTSQVIANGVATFIVWDTEVLDTDNMFSPGAPDRVTIRTAGLYNIYAFTSLEGANWSEKQSGILINGSIWLALNEEEWTEDGTASNFFYTHSGQFRFNVGDTIFVRVRHVSGANRNTNTSSVRPRFTVSRINSLNSGQVSSTVRGGTDSGHPWLWGDGSVLRVVTLYKVAPGY